MKKVLTALVLLFAALHMLAQDWDKNTYRAFYDEKEVALNVDLSKAIVMGVSIEDYPLYYIGKFSSNEKYASLILEKFKNTFKTNFYKYLKKVPVEAENAHVVINYNILEITELGGFSGNYYVLYDGKKSEVIPFQQKDGRWNDFETLLLENSQKFWKSMRNGKEFTYAHYMGGNPYIDKLYIKKKK